MPMLDVDRLVFSFPKPGENARLTVHFNLTESPQKVAGLVPCDDGNGFRFTTFGHITMHLDAETECAVLVTVHGKNALTGDDRTSSLVRPQNYFATPAQRMIDGYSDGEQLQPFYACGEDSDRRTPLVLKVFSVKAEEVEWFKKLGTKCGYDPRGWGTKFLLDVPGIPREPVYEDTRSLGDWDPKSDASAQTKQQITALEEAWVAAALKAKADVIGDMLSDDFVMTGPSGHFSPKAEFVSQFRDGIIVIETAKLEEMEVRTYGSAAVATGMLTIKGHAQDQDLSGSYRFTDTFVQRDGKWVKVAAQFTLIR